MAKQMEQALLGQYPDSWDDYVGQVKAKRTLRTQIASAKLRGENLDHVLIASKFPGIGKTALALCIAREMDVPVFVVSGRMRLQEARMTLTRLEDGNILFIDEAHQLVDGGKGQAEWLLHYLENGTLMGPTGPEPAPNLTVIAATTDVGRLPQTLRERFTIQPELVPYSDDEGAQIAQHMAGKLLGGTGLPVPDEDTAVEIARAASNRPRYMRRLLMGLRDLAVTEQITVTEGGTYPMGEVMEFCGLSPDGLTIEAREYLRVLATEMGGGPAGEKVIAQRLGQVGSGMADVESLLLDKGFIVQTGRGRLLTGPGIRRAQAIEAEEAA